MVRLQTLLPEDRHRVLGKEAVSESPFSFIDLFAGIGGIRLAFESVGGQCLFSSERDPHCQKTYLENFGEQPFGDINEINIDDIPDHDCLTAGFPCQPFSIAGVSKKNSLGREHGFLDRTQGTLFFKIAEILKRKRPAAFLLENVKNLRSHDKGNTFRTILGTLDELGYLYFYDIFDSVNFVPQHRERIYIVGFDRRRFGDFPDFTFPVLPQSRPRLSEILESSPEEKYTLSDKLWNWLQQYALKHRAKGNGFGFGLADLSSHTRTLSARYYKDGSEILIPRPRGNPRRLSPRECARLMGFGDDFKIPVSDTQAYKQFGNSVVVPVVRAIAAQVVKTVIPVIANEHRSRH
jgi:DNA (cytosine-5)-methyltransferase 1